MAKTNITQYSATPSSNTDINSINIDENCPASGLNNAIRELMAHLKNVDTGSQALTALSVTGDLTVTGDIVSNTAGTSNFRAGVNAGDAIASGGNYNTVVGDEAGTAITTGDSNVAVGFEALKTNTTGSNNTALGDGSLESNTTASNNTAVGSLSLDANTEGASNVAVGRASLTTNTTGSGNVGIGVSALEAVSTGSNNTSVGNNSLVSATGSNNTAFGNGAGSSITSGIKSTIVGSYNGNQSGLDIRATNNHIVLSDGDGNPDFFKNNGSGVMGTWFTGNRTNSSYWPKTGTNSSQHGVSFDGEAGQIGATSDGIPLYLNRNDSDGVIIVFYAQGNNEGNISVSGTTVSYNGGHLSRWSQLSDGSKDTTIVKGTVMTNLDQMCVWSHDAIAVGDEIKNACGETIIATANDVKDAYTEDNEQLNCMAVSSVEGDANVAGVFVSWDDKDDFNDMNVAMTGDMVIRIAQGTTVARGDLLMSAGDGTAKPQGDDIVRSKTIAKIISTNVSHTYDDGSYLVPCVVMAC